MPTNKALAWLRLYVHCAPYNGKANERKAVLVA